MVVLVFGVPKEYKSSKTSLRMKEACLLALITFFHGHEVSKWT